MNPFDPLSRLAHEIADLWPPQAQARIVAYYTRERDLWACPLLSPVDRVYLTCVTEAARPMAGLGRLTPVDTGDILRTGSPLAQNRRKRCRNRPRKPPQRRITGCP